MWTVVDGVHRKENVRILKVVTTPPIASVVSAKEKCVKVIILVCNIQNVSLYVIAPTCDDRVMNANETDMDCGGWCAPKRKCENLRSCHNSSDCISGVCEGKICQGNCTSL